MVTGNGGSGRHWLVLTDMWRCACVLALLCVALLRCNAHKRAEMSPVPFVLSARYGRSSSHMMMPRGDRFFMSARYGKRSEAGVAGSRAAVLRRYCDCENYASRPHTSYFYKRSMGAPETVPT